MISRIALAGLGLAHWRQAYDNGSYKEGIEAFGLAEQLQTPVTFALITLLVIGVLLNLLSWRKSSTTQLLIHYELVFNSVYALVPYEYGDSANFQAFYWTLCIFLFASCG